MVDLLPASQMQPERMMVETVVGLPISKLNQFNWNGKSFIGPHGSVRPNFDALNDAEPTTLLNNLSPSTIDFVEVYDEVADTITNYNYSISLNWDFIGLYTALDLIRETDFWAYRRWNTNE